MTSPKYIVGESYSGLRGPRLVRDLINNQSVGITGLVLISPKLDYGGTSNALDPLSWVSVLPSEAAVERAKKGPVTRADMADVEAYAAGDYLVDLVRGNDPAAVARRPV
jgi:carboxypeptidase C (cathepsin A)